MIKKIHCFNEHREAIFGKTYKPTMDDQHIENMVLSSRDTSFIESRDLIVYKKFERLYVCFVVEGENEMYVLGLITSLMDLINESLGQLNEKRLIYNFRDVDYIIDNFILDGKIIMHID